jgi:hypothetical protein
LVFNDDYVELVVDKRSTTGYCTLLGGNLVTWRSKDIMFTECFTHSSSFKKFSVPIFHSCGR